MEFNTETTNVYTSNLKNILGLANKEYVFRNPEIMLFCFKEMVPVCSQYLSKVKSLEELNVVVQNIKRFIEESFLKIEKAKVDIADYKEKIKHLKTIKVIRSNKTVGHFIRKLEEKEKHRTEWDICWPSFEDSVFIENGHIVIPHTIEPFWYNTEDNLLQFDIGDKVEITFGTGCRIRKGYKGQTIQFVVNNVHRYDAWGSLQAGLALTPIKENWLKKDVIFLESYDRFDTMMDGLFPENRRPFSGWMTKTIDIKKIGKVDSIPKPKISNKKTLADLTHPGDDVDVFLGHSWSTGEGYYRRDEYSISGIAKGYHYQCRRIYTTADVQMGVDLFMQKIDKEEKCIEALQQSIKLKNIMLDGAEMIKKKNILPGDLPCPS